MRRYIILILCFVGFISACKKDKSSPEPKGSIYIGDQMDMIVNVYDTLLIRDIYKNFIEIDLNRDNIQDYRFCSFNLTATAMGAGPANGASLSRMR